MDKSVMVEISSTDGFYFDYVKDLAIGFGGKIIAETCPSNFLPPYKMIISESYLSNEGKEILGVNKE